MSCLPAGIGSVELKWHNIPARVVIDAKVNNPDVSKLSPYPLIIELELKGTNPPPGYSKVEVDGELQLFGTYYIEDNCEYRCWWSTYTLFYTCDWQCSRTFDQSPLLFSKTVFSYQFSKIDVTSGKFNISFDLVRALVDKKIADKTKGFHIEINSHSAKVLLNIYYAGSAGRVFAKRFEVEINKTSGEVVSKIGQRTQGPSNCDEGCPGSCSQCAYAKQGYTCKEIQTVSGTYCCCTKPSTGTPQPGSYHAIVESYDIPPTAEPNKWYDFSIKGRVLYQDSPPPEGYVAIEYVDGPSDHIEIRYSSFLGATSVSKGRRSSKGETRLRVTKGVIEFKGQILFPQAGIYKLRIVAGYSQDKVSRNDRDSKDVTVSVKEPGGQPPLGTGCPSGYTCVPPLLCQDPSKQNGTCPGPSPLVSWVCCKQDPIGPRDTSPTCPEGSRVTKDVYCDCNIVKDLGDGKVCCSDVVDQCSPGYECVPASQCQGETRCKCKNCGSTECVCCKKPECPSDAPCMPVDQCLDLGGTCTGSCSSGCCCRLPQPQPSPPQPQQPSPTQQPQPRQCLSDAPCMPVQLCRSIGGICTGSCPDGCCCRSGGRGPMPE